MQRTAMNEDLSPTKTKQNERMNDLRSRSRMRQKKQTKDREKTELISAAKGVDLTSGTQYMSNSSYWAPML